MPHYGKWQSSKIGGGGYVLQVLATSDPKVYYCFIDNSGMYRSEDGGNSWRMLHGSLPPVRGCYNVRGLIVDPRDDKKIIAALGTRWDPVRRHLPERRRRQELALLQRQDDDLRRRRSLSAAGRSGPGPGPEKPGCGPGRQLRHGLVAEHRQRHELDDVRAGGHPAHGRVLRSPEPGSRLAVRQPSKEAYQGKNHGLAGGFYESLDAGKTWKKMADEGPSRSPKIPRTPAGSTAFSASPASRSATMRAAPGK